jgi:hypothetical protein
MLQGTYHMTHSQSYLAYSYQSSHWKEGRKDIGRRIPLTKRRRHRRPCGGPTRYTLLVPPIASLRTTSRRTWPTRTQNTRTRQRPSRAKSAYFRISARPGKAGSAAALRHPPGGSLLLRPTNEAVAMDSDLLVPTAVGPIRPVPTQPTSRAEDLPAAVSARGSEDRAAQTAAGRHAATAFNAPYEQLHCL